MTTSKALFRSVFRKVCLAASQQVSMNSNDAMKYSQAILNLSYAAHNQGWLDKLDLESKEG